MSTERGSRLADAELVITSALLTFVRVFNFSFVTVAAALSLCFSLADWFLDEVGCCHQLLQVGPLGGLQKLLHTVVVKPGTKVLEFD